MCDRVFTGLWIPHPSPAFPHPPIPPEKRNNPPTMEHSAQVGLLDKFSKMTPVGVFAFSIIIGMSTLYSQFVSNSKKTDDNTTQITDVKAEVAAHQKQLDQEVALQEQLKALAEQNKMTQQEVHELSVNLHEFENRFISIPHR